MRVILGALLVSCISGFSFSSLAQTGTTWVAEIPGVKVQTQLAKLVIMSELAPTEVTTKSIRVNSQWYDPNLTLPDGSIRDEDIQNIQQPIKVELKAASEYPDLNVPAGIKSVQIVNLGFKDSGLSYFGAEGPYRTDGECKARGMGGDCQCAYFFTKKENGKWVTYSKTFVR